MKTEKDFGFADFTERMAYLEKLLSGRLPTEPSGPQLLHRLMNPAVRGPFVEALLRQPWSTLQGVINNLVAAGDPRAVLVLIPLLHSPEEPVVLLAIEALQRLRTAAARPALTERITYDRRPEVRKAAQAALESLATAPDTPLEELQLPLDSAFLTIIDGAGGQMAIVARTWDLSTLATFNVILNDTEGIVDSFGSPADPPIELTDMLDDLEDDGFTPVPTPLPEVRESVAQAYQQSLETRGRVSATFVAWRSILAGDDPREIPPVTLPTVNLEQDFELFAESHKLLDLDEFSTWYFDLDEIRPALEKLRRLQRMRDDPKYESQLVSLIRQTLSQYMTPERRQLFKRRLERQAVFLMRIYEDPIHARRALAAAAGLDEAANIPPSEHPFFQEMLMRSFEEYLGRPLTDKRKPKDDES